MVLVVTMPKMAVKIKEMRKRTERNGVKKTVKSRRRKKITGRRMNQPKRKRKKTTPKISPNKRPTNFPTAELRL